MFISDEKIKDRCFSHVCYYHPSITFRSVELSGILRLIYYISQHVDLLFAIVDMS